MYLHIYIYIQIYIYTLIHVHGIYNDNCIYALINVCMYVCMHEWMDGRIDVGTYAGRQVGK